MRQLTLIAMASISLTAAQAQPIRLYVAVDGNDAWSGRLARPNSRRTDGPFATLQRAQKAVRELKAKGMVQPIEVVVRQGTYYLVEPLVFTPEDSGSDQAPITYRAERLGKVILSGGRVVSGWRKVGEGLWSASIPEARTTDWTPRLLRVGDRWAIRARHPNFDAKNPLDWRLAVCRFSWRAMGAGRLRARRWQYSQSGRYPRMAYPRA